jgi:hypothetical protein
MTSEKPYTVEMEDRGEYLWVLVSGEKVTAAIAAAYWNEIADRCFELDRNKLLIEKNFKQTVGPDEMILMAEHVGKLLPTRRIALFDRWGHQDINELGKKLARNRDVMFQTFDNLRDAERWLLAN